MSDRRPPWWTLCLLLVLLAPRPSHAQSAADRATARRFAEEADEKAKRKDYAGALDLFLRADSLVPAPTLKLEAARLRVQLGQLVEGQQLMLEISRGQAAAGEPPSWARARAAAATEAAALNARLSAVEITVEGGAPENPPRVILDGQPLPPAAVGAPRVVNPGTHAIRAEQDGQSVADMTVTVREGQTQKVVLRVTGSAAPRPPGPVAAPATPAAIAAAPEPWHHGLYLRLGLGVALHSSTLTDNVSLGAGSVSTKTSVSGAGPALDFALGAAISPGLIIAGDLGGHSITNPTLKTDCSAANCTSTGKGTATYVRIGALVDYYIGNGGLHVQGGIGYAAAKYTEDNPTPNYPAVDLKGFGLNAGVGYEFRVGKSWGLGGLLRVDIPSLKQTTSVGTLSDDRTFTGFIPGLMLTATDN